MRRVVGSVTRRGQVTLPVEVRRRLGIESPGKVIFEIDDDDVRLTRQEWTLETVFGSLPPLPKGMTIDEAIELANEEHAEHVAREGL